MKRWIFMLALGSTAGAAFAQTASMPNINFSMGGQGGPKDLSISFQILFLLTILALAPSILIMVTSFTRIIIVLSLTRSAMGTQQVPPNAVLVGLALFLTFFTMSPIIGQVNNSAIQPYLRKQISYEDAMTRGMQPIRSFMFKQTREKDLQLFVALSHSGQPASENQVETHILIPAFIISELQTGFTMGFVIFIPFLIIDMVVGVTLMSMGMMMLPPVMVSLPLKILLFVMADGWHLIAQSLVSSFNA